MGAQRPSGRGMRNAFVRAKPQSFTIPARGLSVPRIKTTDTTVVQKKVNVQVDTVVKTHNKP
jgi:hypothetical protein